MFQVKYFRSVYVKHLKAYLEGVLCIADDIIIHGKDDQKHHENLERIVARCCEKLEIRCSQIAFHGHTLTSEGLKIDPDKVRAIHEMPRPQNPNDVQRRNSMVNYLSHFYHTFLV